MTNTAATTTATTTTTTTTATISSATPTTTTAMSRPNLQVSPYVPGSTPWGRWIQRLEGAFSIMKTAEEDKANFLLHYVGDTAYNALCDNLDNVYGTPYDDLKAKLSKLYSPELLEIAENFKFNSRKQLPGESIQDFATNLNKLSKECQFGAHLQKALRNQFVFGLSNKRIQSRLLETANLTFDLALTTASTMDLCAKEASTIREETKIQESVNFVSDKKKFNKNNYKSNSAKNKEKQNSEVKNYSDRKCFRCGNTNHLANKCKLPKDIVCKSCNKTGHLQKVCMKKGAGVNQIEQNLFGLDTVEIFTMDDELQFNRTKFTKQLEVNGQLIDFEVDSGAAVTLISAETARKLFPNLQIQRSSLRLVTFCKTSVNVLGFYRVNVKFESEIFKLNLYVTEIERLPLCGREWIREFLKARGANRLFSSVFSMDEIANKNFDKEFFIKQLLRKYPDVVRENLSAITGLGATLTLKSDAKPVFMKARSVPFRMIDLIDKELNFLEKEGVIERVETSSFATPIVPVLKKDGTVRICGDYSVTVNPQLRVNEYPLPTTDELFSDLAGCRYFAKIDCSQAYLQLPVDDESAELLTINTHRGLYRVKRMMFGIAAAPAIWQEKMNFLFGKIKGVRVFQDDIRLAASTLDGLTKLIDTVFKILNDHNIKIKLSKCTFFENSIKYCGYVIDANGIHKDPSKIEAVAGMPKPKNVGEVRSFIALVNYYNKFIPKISEILQPFFVLLRKGEKFVWTDVHDRAFEEAKAAFTRDTCLAFYDPTRPLVLATDASPTGVGAVLSHTYDDGSERPIMFVSKTLNAVQATYSQIDKEALAIVFAVKKLHQYLYGTKFTLYTDNKPLSQIFSPDKSLPVYSAMRMQHYAIFLRGFNYSVKYKKSDLNGNADCLSRLSLPISDESLDVVDVFHLETLDTMSIDVYQMRENMGRDQEFMNVLSAVEKGGDLDAKNTWNIDPREFSVENGLLMRNHRVVVPKPLRGRILSELHAGHFGIVKMKSLARGYCWWPGIDSDIEKLANSCESCLLNRNNPAKTAKHVWEPATAPFERVHIDFAGPFMGHYFFILVDAFSKWPEIHIVKNMLAENTVAKCREIFSEFGLPEVLVSDNGPTFTSNVFEKFLKDNGILHKFSAPYHPATNGQAERYVQTIKSSLEKMNDARNIRENVLTILFQYRNMPHRCTGTSPAELFLGRKIRNRLNLLKPVIEVRCDSIDKDISFRKLKLGQRVIARNYTEEGKWCFGKIKSIIGKLHYVVLLDDGREWKRHIDQIRIVNDKTKISSVAPARNCGSDDLEYYIPPEERLVLGGGNRLPAVDPRRQSVSSSGDSDSFGSCGEEDTISIQSNQRPQREKRLPARLADYVLGP